MVENELWRILKAPETIAEVRDIHQQLMDKNNLFIHPDSASEWAAYENGAIAWAELGAVQDCFEQEYANGTLRERLKGAFVERLDMPRILSQADVTRAFRDHLLVPVEQFDEAWLRFRAAITSNVGNPKHSHSFAIGTARTDPFEPVDKTSKDWERLAQFDGWYLGYAMSSDGSEGIQGIWNRNGVFLVLDGFKESDGRHRTIHARMVGRASSRALRQMSRTIRLVVRSIFRSIQLMEECAVNGGNQFDKRLPIINVATTLDSQLGFVRACLDAYYFNPSTRQSMAYRMKMALALLVQADTQSHSSIRLALAMSAVEALLAKKPSDGKPSITEQLKDNASALLEPESSNRKAAKKVIGQLYDARSDVLHGSRIDEVATKSKAIAARRLAAAVLHAVWQRTTFQRRLGEEPEHPDEFFAALRNANADDHRVDGVSELHVINLWRSA